MLDLHVICCIYPICYDGAAILSPYTILYDHDSQQHTPNTIYYHHHFNIVYMI